MFRKMVASLMAAALTTMAGQAASAQQIHYPDLRVIDGIFTKVTANQVFMDAEVEQVKLNGLTKPVTTDVVYGIVKNGKRSIVGTRTVTLYPGQKVRIKNLVFKRESVVPAFVEINPTRNKPTHELNFVNNITTLTLRFGGQK